MTLIPQIWHSFRALPYWVQIWVFGILVPVNMISLFFLEQPFGVWVAVLAIGAMVLNGLIMLRDRGFSKAMALPHVPVWSVLVLWLIFRRPGGTPAYDTYLTVLQVVNAISLIFDYRDALKWMQGDRDVAGSDRP